MKRNILLLTAVVLAAVLLSGCTLWPFGANIKVTYKLEEGVFQEDGLTKKVEKSAMFKQDLEFANKEDTRDAEDFELKVLAGKTKIEAKLEDLTGDTKGIKVVIPNVGKKDIEINVTLKPAEGE